MQVYGDNAKGWAAVRLDSLEQINKGVLLEADDYTGTVKWKDRYDTVHMLTLGAHAIRILRSSAHGR